MEEAGHAGPAPLAWVILGFLSPGYTIFGTRIAPYSPVSQPVSGLGLGPTGPFMNAAFILGGLLLFAGVIAVFQTIPTIGRPAARRASLALLALTPLGMVVDGIFTLEDVLAHPVGFLLAVGSPVVGFLVAGRYLRGIPGWRRFGTWMLLGSPLTLLLVVLFFLSFDPTANGAQEGVAGLIQRLLTIELFTWLVAMGWLAFRVPRSGDTQGGQALGMPPMNEPTGPRWLRATAAPRPPGS